MANWRYEMLVAIHELIETILCKDKGITQNDVDTFDKVYEEIRTEDSITEPGDHPSAPYNKQHSIATGIERILCAEMGLDWNTYDQTVEAL